MVSVENLNKLYDLAIVSDMLTTKELKEIGFSSYDLNKLIEKGVIERVKRGYFKFLSVDELYLYGKSLLNKREYEKALKCFKKCFSINKHHGASFQLFLHCIRHKDYEGAFFYFDYIYSDNNEFYNRDANYYLYLLSMITKVPDKYQSLLKTMELKDALVSDDDRRYSDISEYNKVRGLSFNQRFVQASRQLHYILKKNGQMRVHDITSNLLLNQAIASQELEKKTIVQLAKNGEYEELREFLQEIDRQHSLSFSDNYVMQLVKAASELKNSDEEIEVKPIKIKSLFDAIDARDYHSALELSNEYLSSHNIDSQSNAINLLLKRIVDTLEKRKEESASNKEAIIDNDKIAQSILGQDSHIASQQDLEVSSQHISQHEEQDSQVYSQHANHLEHTSQIDVEKINNFNEVVNCLTNNDIDRAYYHLNKYLINISKSDYEFLIINLIKLSLLEKDYSFTRPLIVLSQVGNGIYNFDLKNYIKQFYDSLGNGNFEEARVYLDIIKGSREIGIYCPISEMLEEIFKVTREYFEGNEDIEFNYGNNIFLDDTDSSKQNIIDSSPTLPLDSPIDSPTVSTTTSSSAPTGFQSTDDKKMSTTVRKVLNKKEEKDMRFDADKFISELLCELYEKGVILLKPMSRTCMNKIHEATRRIKDIVSFEIGSNDKQIVLRYNPYIEERISVRDLSREARSAYHNGDYDNCIAIYRKLIEFGVSKAYVYAGIGLAYYKKFQRKKAIDYLKIATELTKNEDGRFDFSDLIFVLEGHIEPEDKKPKVWMRVDDFEKGLNDNYGIDNYPDIRDLINAGENLDNICESLNINNSDKLIIMLLLARDAYAASDYFLGDRYLKSVEKSKEKNKEVVSLLDEIRKNKRFYKNRGEDNYCLVRS